MISMDVIPQLNALKLATGSVNKTPQPLSRFCERGDCQTFWDVKRDLQKIIIEDVDMPGQNKLFTNKRLYLYYKKNMGKKQEFRKFRQSP